LLGPEHRQVSQALDAESARKATLHRGFRQDGGDEREGHRHPDRALALAFADGELTRTSPGSAKADGAEGSRARAKLAAPDDDTNARRRTESQSFVRKAMKYAE
jgi:hypothetical protein